MAPAPAPYEFYEDIYPALRRLIPCEMGRFAAIVREVARETRGAASPAEALAIANRVVDRHIGEGDG